MELGDIQCRITDSKSKIIGVTTFRDGKDDAALVITTDSEVRVEGMKANSPCSANWMYRTGSERAVTVAAVKHPKNGMMLAGCGKDRSTLMTWSNKATDIKQASVKTLSASIHSILVNTALPKSAVIALTSGKIQIVDATTLKFLHEVKAPVDSKVLWTQLVPLQKSKALVYMLYKSKSSSSDNATTLCVLSLSKCPSKNEWSSVVSLTHCLESRRSSGTTVQSCTLHRDSSLSILWKSGEWERLELKPTGDRRQQLEVAAVQNVVTLKNNPKKKGASSSRKRKHESTTTSSSTFFHLCAVGVASTSCETLVLNSSDKNVSGYDAAYGVQLVSSIGLPKSSKYVGMQTISGGNSVMLVFENSIVVVEVQYSTVTGSSTLLSVLGKASASLPPVAVTVNLGKQLGTLEKDDGKLEKWNENLSKLNAAENSTIEKLVSKSTSKSEFVTLFNKHVYRNNSKSVSALSFVFVQKVAKRCIESESLWKPLQVLIRSKRMSLRALPDLMSVLMKNKQYVLIVDVLKNVSDIPELMYVKIIRFLVSRPIDDEKSVAECFKSYSDVKLTVLENCLCMIVGASKNEALFQVASRAFSMPEVLLMLAFLKKMYGLQGVHESNKKTVLPSRGQVLEWIAILLDTHFHEFVLQSSQESSITRLLSECQKLVESEMVVCEEMAQVHGELSHFFTKSTKRLTKLPVTAIPDYSVDKLEL